LVVTFFGTKISFIIDGAFFVCAIFILSQINFNVEFKKIELSIINSIKEGITYIKQHKYLIHYMILHASVGLTAFDTLVTLLADYSYKYILSVPLAIGLTNAVRAFALMIGPFIITKWIDKKKMVYLFVIQGCSIILWSFLQSNFYFGLFGMFLTGLTTTTIWSYTYAMLQDEVHIDYLGRVLAYNEMFFMLGNVTVTLFIGVLATYIKLQYISILLGIGFLAFGYYYKTIILKKENI